MSPYYMSTKINDRITQIRDIAGVSCYLVAGDTQAVLLDAGNGLIGLKDVIGGITSLPTALWLTHGHVDHIGSSGLFADVYMHPDDDAVLHEHMTHSSVEYVNMMTGGQYTLTASDFSPLKPFQYLPLHDGMTMDLGGVTLECIHVPGHSPGSVCVLMRELRTILFGDSCNPNTLLLGTTVEEYLQSLLHLKQFEAAYDTVLSSHGPATLPKTCLDDNVDLCKRIIAGTDDHIPVKAFGMTGFKAARTDDHYQRLDGRCGNIVYGFTSRKENE